MSEAVIVAALGFAGTLTGAYLANRKTSALIAYRLEQLEKKVDKHNSVIERTFELEKRAALGRKSMADDLVVPQIHVQCQFVIYALHRERRHVTDNALKRLVDTQFCHKQIGKNTSWIAWLFILVMLRFAFDPGYFTAFMSIRSGKDKTSIQADLGVEPPVAVGRVFHVVFLKQHNVADQILCSFRRI